MSDVADHTFRARLRISINGTPFTQTKDVAIIGPIPGFTMDEGRALCRQPKEATKEWLDSFSAACDEALPRLTKERGLELLSRTTKTREAASKALLGLVLEGGLSESLKRVDELVPSNRRGVVETLESMPRVILNTLEPEAFQLAIRLAVLSGDPSVVDAAHGRAPHGVDLVHPWKSRTSPQYLMIIHRIADELLLHGVDPPQERVAR